MATPRMRLVCPSKVCSFLPLAASHRIAVLSHDPVTTCLEMLPLFALYELSIVLLRLTERRDPS